MIQKECTVKSWSRIGFIFTLVLTMVIAAVPVKVSAGQISKLRITNPDIAPGSWTWTSEASGSEVQPDKLTTQAPTWRLLITDGIVLSGPAYLCHEFTGNQIGWMGDIYMLNGDSWTKLVTTVDWVPTIEGHLMACAQAPAAGTYALFAYWEKPEGWQPPNICKPISSALIEKNDFNICNFELNPCFCQINIIIAIN